MINHDEHTLAILARIDELCKIEKAKRGFWTKSVGIITIVGIHEIVKKFSTGKKLRYWKDTDTDDSKLVEHIRFIIKHDDNEYYYDAHAESAKLLSGYIGQTVQYYTQRTGRYLKSNIIVRKWDQKTLEEEWLNKCSK